MSQDIISDTLNKIMNGKRSHKEKIVVDKYSKLLINILEIAKNNDYILSYNIDNKKLDIKFDDKLNKCKSIKPRFDVNVSEIEKYMRRFLPARDVGIMIISTSRGLMTHKEAIEKNVGGCLIAYFY